MGGRTVRRLGDAIVAKFSGRWVVVWCHAPFASDLAHAWQISFQMAVVYRPLEVVCRQNKTR